MILKGVYQYDISQLGTKFPNKQPLKRLKVSLQQKWVQYPSQIYILWNAIGPWYQFHLYNHFEIFKTMRFCKFTHLDIEVWWSIYKQGTRSSLVQVMACCQFCTKPLLVPMLCLLPIRLLGTNFSGFQINIKKCHLENCWSFRSGLNMLTFMVLKAAHSTIILGQYHACMLMTCLLALPGHQQPRSLSFIITDFNYRNVPIRSALR